MRVAVDAGHGGHDPGASGAQTTEDKLVQVYSQELAALLLGRGHAVLQTRPGDEFVTLSERAARANDFRADTLVSLHANASSREAANGAWVIYDDKSSPANGPALARMIFDELREIPGVEDEDSDREIFADGTAWVGNRQLSVISRARMPAVLVELGFLTNPGDEEQLLDPVTRSRVVRALAEGIEAWGFSKGLIEPVVVDRVDPLPPEFMPTDLPDRIEPLLHSPARATVEAYASADESTGGFVLRILERMKDDPNVQHLLSRFERWALEWLVTKLRSVLKV